MSHNKEVVNSGVRIVAPCITSTMSHFKLIDIVSIDKQIEMSRSGINLSNVRRAYGERVVGINYVISIQNCSDFFPPIT